MMTDRTVDRRWFLKAASALGAGATAFGFEPQQWNPAPPQKSALQFSLAHLTVLGCAPPEMTYIAARAGYDFVSYRIIYMGLPGEANYALAQNADMLRQTKKALADTGLKVNDIELARIADDKDVKTYVPALETAAELGAKHVISSIWSANRNYAVDSFAQLCDLAKKVGLTVDLEFVTFANVTNLREAIAVCKEVNRDNCGVLVDTLHFNRSRVKPEELDAVPRNWFHFAHICDAPAEIPTTNEGLILTAREARLYLGEGAIDMAAILNRMPVVPYSIELPHLARVKELGYAEHARRCLDSAKKYFAAHPRG